MGAHYFCGRYSKPCIPCAARHHVDCPQPDRMVANVSASDWLETFQTGRNENEFHKKVFFRQNKTFSVVMFLCAYVWNQCFGAVPLFRHHGNADAVLYQFWNNGIATQYFPVLYIGTDRRRIGMARLYAGGI